MPSHYVDQLHRLIGRLCLRPKPIGRLEIAVKFPDNYAERDTAFYVTQLLLNPFWHLCQAAKLQLLSITINDLQKGKIELLCPRRICAAACRTFAKYIECLSKGLSSSEPSLKCTVRICIHSSINLRASACRPYHFHVEARLVMLVSVSGCSCLNTLFLMNITCIFSSSASFH